MFMIWIHIIFTHICIFQVHKHMILRDSDTGKRGSTNASPREDNDLLSPTGRRGSIPRSVSDPCVTDAIKKFQLRCKETSSIFTIASSEIVTEYSELRCIDKKYDIFQHSDEISIIVFKDPTYNRCCVFAIGPVLGKGQEGTVCLAQDLTAKQIKLVAVKQKECSTRASKRDCINEYKILEYLTYVEGFFREGRMYHLFMTYLPGFDASRVPRDFPDVIKKGWRRVDFITT